MTNIGSHPLLWDSVVRQAAVGASLVEGDVALCGVGEELGLREFIRRKSRVCKVLYQIFLYLCDRISYVG